MYSQTGLEEIDVLNDSQFKLAVSRGFNLPRYHDAVDDKDDELITILHPWNYLTEDELGDLA
jgi:hypothetical protein